MPIANCDECKEWLFVDGEKLRKREPGEEPPCEKCPMSFDWHPEAFAALRLFQTCGYDITSGTFRHLPKVGGVEEQDPKQMAYLEIAKFEFLRRRKKE